MLRKFINLELHRPTFVSCIQMEPVKPALEILVAATQLMKSHMELVNQSTHNWVDVVQDHLRADRATLDVIFPAIGALDMMVQQLNNIDRWQTMME